MNEREALLRTISDDPHDDAPRLVFADWCQENGDEDRAEFIRLQIERSRLPEFDPSQAELQARELRLLGRNGTRWCDGLPTIVRFRRGFPDEMNTSASEFNERWRSWFARELFRAVRFAYDPREESPFAAELPTDSESVPFSGLTIWAPGNSPQTQAIIASVLRSPALAGLRSLGLEGCRFDEGGFGALWAECPPIFSDLRSLDISRMGLNGPELASVIAGSPQSLERLCCGANQPFEPADLRALVESDLWGRLEELAVAVSASSLGECCEVLFGGLAESRISRLRLEQSRRMRGVMAALATADWGGLRALRLSASGVSDEEFRLLLAHRDFSRIESLTLLGATESTPDLLTPLAECPNAGGLRSLTLSSDRITDEGMAALAGSHHLSGLQELHINGSVSHRGMRELLSSPNAEQLRELTVTDDDLDRVLIEVANSEHLPNLTVLRGTHSHHSARPFRFRAGEEALSALAESPRLPNLSHVAVWGQHTERSVAALLAAEHIAWPGFRADDCPTPELRRRYEQRFGPTVTASVFE